MNRQLLLLLMLFLQKPISLIFASDADKIHTTCHQVLNSNAPKLNVSLASFKNPSPVTTTDYSFPYTYIDKKVINQNEFAIIVENDSDKLKKIIELIIRNILKESNVSEPIFAAYLGDAFERLPKNIGLPGIYATVNKEFSLKILLNIPKFRGNLNTKKDLQNFVFLQKNSNSNLFSSIIEQEFNQLSEFNSPLRQGSLKFEVQDPSTKKNFQIKINFNYYYQIIASHEWAIHLATGNGITNHIMLEISPSTLSTLAIPSKEELERLTNQFLDPLKLLLKNEKERR